MSAYTRVTLYCDKDDGSCTNRVEGSSVLDARRKADSLGWLTGAGHGTADYCPKHKPEGDR